jgi:hypothetical protein
MDRRKLDWSKLLGFDATRDGALDLRGATRAERLRACAALGARVSGKVGEKGRPKA